MYSIRSSVHVILLAYCEDYVATLEFHRHLKTRVKASLVDGKVYKCRILATCLVYELLLLLLLFLPFCITHILHEPLGKRAELSHTDSISILDASQRSRH